MQDNIRYSVALKGELNSNDILTFFKSVDDDFVPKFSSRVNLKEYSKRLSERAVNICAFSGSKLVGLASVYFNEYPTFSYWTYFAVRSDYWHIGLGVKLEENLIEFCKLNNSAGINGEMRQSNKRLLKMHKAFGFKDMGVYEEANDTEVKIKIQLKF